MKSKPSVVFGGSDVESIKRGGCILPLRKRGNHGRAVRTRRGQDDARSESVMLSVPTLWVTIIINFLSMGLVWTYVMRSYPKFLAARFWAAASLAAALGAGITMLRGVMDPRFPLVIGGGLMVFACSVAVMGLRRFYDVDVQWRTALLIGAATCLGLYVFLVVEDSIPMRMFVYSLGQSISIATALPLLFARREGRDDPGA